MRKKDKERDLKKLYFSTGKYPKKGIKYLDEKRFNELTKSLKFYVKVTTEFEGYSTDKYTKSDVARIAGDGLGVFHVESRYNYLKGYREKFYMRKLKRVSISRYYGYPICSYFIFNDFKDGDYFMTLDEIEDKLDIRNCTLCKKLRKMATKEIGAEPPDEWSRVCHWIEKVTVTRNRSRLHQDLKKIDIDNLDDESKLSAKKDLYEKTDYVW